MVMNGKQLSRRQLEEFPALACDYTRIVYETMEKTIDRNISGLNLEKRKNICRKKN